MRFTADIRIVVRVPFEADRPAAGKHAETKLAKEAAAAAAKATGGKVVATLVEEVTEA